MVLRRWLPRAVPVRSAPLIAGALALLLFAAAGNTEAARVASAGDTTLAPATWALQYSLGSNLIPDTFTGTAVSLQYRVSRQSALRVGIGVFASHAQVTSRYPFGVQTDIPVGNSRHNDFALEFVMTYLRYLQVHESVRLFTGAGPVVTYHASNDKGDYSFPTDDGTASRDWSVDELTYEVGGLVTAGVEWACLESISLHVETGIRALYVSEDSDTDFASRTDMLSHHSTHLRIRPSGVRLGISFYF